VQEVKNEHLHYSTLGLRPPNIAVCNCDGQISICLSVRQQNDDVLICIADNMYKLTSVRLCSSAVVHLLIHTTAVSFVLRAHLSTALHARLSTRTEGLRERTK